MALAIGSTSLVLFSYWRRQWPQMYEARRYRNINLDQLDNSLFGWIRQVFRLKGQDVLRHAGLDAYVYLSFFRLAVTVLTRLSLVALFFIAPLRMYNWINGRDDDDDDDRGDAQSLIDPRTQMFDGYSWVFLATTYVFTIICLWTMREYNSKIISVRQAYLGHQNSITDRTLRISGIPRKLRSEDELMKYVTILFGVEPESVSLCRKWDQLEQSFAERKKLISKLESLWTDYIGPDNAVFNMALYEGCDRTSSYHDDDEERESLVWDDSTDLKSICARLFPDRKRPIGCLGLSGPNLDLLDHYGRELENLDRKIAAQREVADLQPSTNMAFITMKSVAHCQLAAQCIFSPRSHTLVNSLAPAPNDIIWKNVYLHSKQRSVYTYCISLIVLITNVFLSYLLYNMAKLLNRDYIDKHIPWLGDFLSEHKWMSAFVTGVLPTYLVPSFNLVIPYFFAWLTVKQGTVSRSDAQLSTISKNFFYVFVSLFLVFTIEGVVLSFQVNKVDKVAKDFAAALKPLSAFYTNLIILQGIGLTTVRLLQGGTLFQYPFLLTRCNTAREHYNLYKPQKLDYGLFLPMPMLFFILTLTYSILSLRILFFGLIYFAVNYLVFKYQLLYSMVYQHHSNAQLWAIIIRRMYLGIAVFHLAMSGVLVLRSNYTFAVMIVPLSVALGGFWYDFEKFNKPLLEFVAIEALRQKEIDQNLLSTYDLVDGESSFNDEHRQEGDNNNDSSQAPSEASCDSAEQPATDLPSILWGESTLDDAGGAHTLDEIREENQHYVAKVLTDPLDGPWVAANAFECVVANSDGFRRRRIPQTEWL